MRKTPRVNQRTTSRKHRRQQHLLDVKVRSRTAARQRNRRLVKWLCVCVLVTATLGGIYYGARAALDRFFWHNPDYQIAQIDVADDGALSREQIINATGIRMGENIFLVDLSGAREKLARLPQVDHSEVERIFPNKVAITVSERKPVAWVTAKNDIDPSSDDTSLLIDAAGTLLAATTQLPAYLHLPIISGLRMKTLAPGQIVDAPEMRAALDLLRLTSDEPGPLQIRTIDLSKGYCMIVTDQNRAQVTFGLDRLDWQLKRLAVLLRNIEESQREMLTANLMVERNLPVTFVAPDEDVPAETATAGEVKPAPTPRPHALEPKPLSVTKTKHARPATKNPSPSIRKAIPVNGSDSKQNEKG